VAGGVPCFAVYACNIEEWVPHSALFSQGGLTRIGGTMMAFGLVFGLVSAACFDANRIDNVHRQRTLLKTAKGCGTHF